MPIYAQYEPETGKVIGWIRMDKGLLEIPAPLESGRFLVRNGQVIAAPTIGLKVSESETLNSEPGPLNSEPGTLNSEPGTLNFQLGTPVNLVLTLPDYPDPCPDALELLINNKQTLWNRRAALLFEVAGDYTMKIIGPYPWESNQVRFTVKESSQ